MGAPHGQKSHTLCCSGSGDRGTTDREMRKSHGCLGGSVMEKGQAGGRPGKLAWLDAGRSKQWRVGMHEEAGQS